MKALINQPGSRKRISARNGKAHGGTRVPALTAKPGQKARDQWVHGLEAARQTAQDFNIQMTAGEISRDIRSRRGRDCLVAKLKTFLDANIVITAFGGLPPQRPAAMAVLPDAGRVLLVSDYLRLELIARPAYCSNLAADP